MGLEEDENFKKFQERVREVSGPLETLYVGEKTSIITKEELEGELGNPVEGVDEPLTRVIDLVYEYQSKLRELTAQVQTLQSRVEKLENGSL